MNYKLVGLLALMGAASAVDSTETCTSQSCEDEVSMIQIDLEPKKRPRRMQRTVTPVCLASFAAHSAYRFGSGDGQASKQRLERAGAVFQRGFNSSVGGDWDYVGWWKNGDDCILNFQGSDSNADFYNNWASEPRTQWHGIDGVHTGVTHELDILLAQMDLSQISSECNSITAVGHSLGGGIAQLFALAANTGTLPITVDTLYTFGAMSVGEENLPNANAESGCFAGKQYWNARINDAGDPEVDILRAAGVGGLSLEPVKSDKALLFGPGDAQEFPCGQLVPAMGGSGWDLHLMEMYQLFLGCINYPQFMAALRAHGYA